MKQQLSDWSDVLQVEPDLLISAEISDLGREPGLQGSTVEGIHVHILDLFSPLTEYLTAAGSLIVLDRNTQGTKEETEIIRDIIKV